MSGVVKGVKKVFKGVHGLVKKAASTVNRIHKKLRKSKIYKVAIAAAAVYFGGAGLMSMANGGTFMAGVSSAGTSLASAGSSLLSGNLGAAGTHLSAGIQGTVASTATGSAAGGLMTAGAVAPTTTATAPIVAGSTVTAPAVTAPAAGMSVGKGLMYSAGINAASQGIGGYLQARSAEAAADDERKRREYNINNKQSGDFRFNIDSAFQPITPMPRTVNDLRG